MKTKFWLITLVPWLAVSASAQVGQPSPIDISVSDKSSVLQISEVGDHHRVWQRVTVETDKEGNRISVTNAAYIELETGMNVRQPDGSFVAASDEIEIVKDGAVARKGRHQVIFAVNCNSPVTIDMLTADGKRLQSRILGLAFFDRSTGESVLIAEIKDADGQLLLDTKNEVIYYDAFTDFKADVRYRNSKAGLEQDIIVRENPPSPADYKLNPETTVLEVLTEFINPPVPEKKAQFIDGTVNEFLDFGDLKMGNGKVYVMDKEAVEISVTKQWGTLDGRTFLVEEIPYASVETELKALPGRTASLKTLPDGVLHQVSIKRLLPAVKQAKRSVGPMRLASVPLSGKGVVLDYITASSSANFTFRCDTNYYVSGTVNLSGTNTCFEGGVVIKYSPTNTPKLNITSPITWLGSVYRPVVMTARDDNTVGDTFSGSTGNPNTNYFANPALYIDGAAAGTNAILQNLRIAFAQSAIVFNGRTGHVVSHAQFVNCANGITATNAEFSLRNALLYKVLTNFNGSSATGRCEHLTVNTASWLNQSSAITLTMTNSLLVGVTNAGAFTSIAVSTGTSAAFVTVGAAYHYLADNSYRNTGTTNINANLAAELKKLTTYGPVGTISGTISTPTILSPQVARDTDLPDLGYHYAPLDYLCSQVALTTGTAVTLTNGVAVGLYGNYGFGLLENCSFISQGRPEAMNRLAWYPAVQEQSVKINNLSGLGGFFDLNSANSTYTSYTKPILKLSFTDSAGLGRRQPFFNSVAYYYQLHTVALTDNWLRGVDLTVAGYNWTVTGFPVPVVTLQNNLIERSAVNLFNGYFNSSYQNPLAVNLYNNLFWNTTLTLTYNDYGATTHPAWAVKDNLFDNATISMTGSYYSSYVIRSNNRFFNTPTGTQLESSPVNLTALSYATGAFGSRYINASTPTLVDQGSRAANVAGLGLYHYTLFTSNTKEQSSTVDVGFHYVAAGADNRPLDTDSDGLADCLEDRNGNETVDSGETDWNNASDFGLSVRITKPRSGTILP